MEGVSPGPGWYCGEWPQQYGSWPWQWSGDGAPHAPGPNGGGDWSQVQDDALFMQFYTLADDGSYVPHDEAAPGVADAARLRAQQAQHRCPWQRAGPGFD